MKKTLPVLATLFLFLLAGLTDIQAQKKVEKKKFQPDNNYYETYRNKLTTRIFVAQKFAQFRVPASGSAQDIQYSSNHNVKLGVGVTWHNLTLNLSYGFSFLNKNREEEKGETKGIDLQLRLFPRKWAIDILAVMPRGMYIHPKGYAADDPSEYYSRPDVKERLFGIGAYYVPNKEKFSYRAALVQNEWQKKSAGSPLYGGEILYGIVEGKDSAFVPKKIQANFPQAGITEMNYISVGPGIGYAYTLVMDQHFFITGALIGNLKVNLTKEEIGSAVNKKTSFDPTANYKAAIGYNSNNWSICANISGNLVLVKANSSTMNYFMSSGAWRVMLAKKFDVKKKHSK